MPRQQAHDTVTEATDKTDELRLINELELAWSPWTKAVHLESLRVLHYVKRKETQARKDTEAFLRGGIRDGGIKHN